ncbi:MAG: polysaccharide deacetylase family protein [Planctomycetota bacterium]|jgi:peptidoglycan/xylan/chitin deacetylase (PgdA/CDA1 family)
MSSLIPIYMYHHVVSKDNLPQDAHLYVTDNTLAEQILLLRHWGYEFLSLSQAWEKIKSGEKPGKSAVLTFDDVYYDFYESAFPILREFDVPATIFAISGNICNSDVPYRVAPGLYGITASHLREMSDSGMEVGAHTVTHRELTSLSDEEAWVELNESKDSLEEIIDAPVKNFCYPRGRFSPRIVDIVKECGFECSVSTLRGNKHSVDDQYCLKRIRSGEERKGFKLKYTTSAVYNIINTRRVKRETERLFSADRHQ